MKSITLFSFALFVVLFSSCRVLFENPQPLNAKALKAVPSELIGTYLEEEESDTLIITQNSYLFDQGNSLSDEMSRGALSSGRDVLKKFGKYYVYSKLANDSASEEPKAWYVYLLKLDGKRLVVSHVETDSYNERDTLDMGLLRKITPVKVMEESGKGDDAYLINPGKKQFKAMISNGLFKTAYKFKRVD